MGQSLNNIKRRINTINSTRKITSSMKLVSNVKCRRFMVEEYEQREYSSLLRKIILDCIKLDSKYQISSLEINYIHEIKAYEKFSEMGKRKNG